MVVILQKPCCEYRYRYIPYFEIKRFKKSGETYSKILLLNKFIHQFMFPFCPSLYYPSFLYTLPTLNVFLTLFMTSTVELRSQT